YSGFFGVALYSEGRRAFKAWVAGSNPAALTMIFCKIGLTVPALPFQCPKKCPEIPLRIALDGRRRQPACSRELSSWNAVVGTKLGTIHFRALCSPLGMFPLNRPRVGSYIRLRRTPTN